MKVDKAFKFYFTNVHKTKVQMKIWSSIMQYHKKYGIFTASSEVLFNRKIKRKKTSLKI